MLDNRTAVDWSHPHAKLHLLIKQWQSDGIIARGSMPTTGHLVDMGVARYQFVLAIGRHTQAWNELVAWCRSMHTAGLDAGDDDGPAGAPVFTVAQRSVVDLWVTTHRIDVPWIRAWTQKAVSALREFFYELDADPEILQAAATDDDGICSPADGPTVQTILFVDSGNLPIPRPTEAIEACASDMYYEIAPYPRLETLEQWLERAADAYAQRMNDADITGRASIKHVARNAERFARFQVGGEKVSEIFAGAHEEDQRTIERAIAKFSELVEVPRRSI
jgi:hypothetical protein